MGPQQSLPPLENDHHTGDYVPNSLQKLRGFFNVPQNLNGHGFWEGDYGLSSLSYEETRKFLCLQLASQRQNFLLGYFKTLSVGPDWGLKQRPPGQQTSTYPIELTGWQSWNLKKVVCGKHVVG